MGKKVLVLVLATIVMLGIFGLTGCEDRGREFEVDGWTLIQFGRGSSKRGQVNILSADSELLAEDGVLYVPAKIGEYRITGFGSRGAPFGSEYCFTVLPNVERIVVSAELYVDKLFWGQGPNAISGSESFVKYVEFLCETFEKIDTLFYSHSNENIVIIIPDRSTPNFANKFSLTLYSVIEKSDFLEQNI